MGFAHIPVMVEEVMALLGCESHQVYVDATLGGGGHALEILKRTAPDGVVIGIEWDEDGISEARKRLSPLGERVKIFRENFIHLPELLKTMKIEGVDGILFDLGLSSIQLEKEDRGRDDRQSLGAVMRVITKKPLTPSKEERMRNPRSRSAKLRCAERV